MVFIGSTEAITNMYADYIDEWKMLISKSFDSAEMQVFDDKPIPDVVGPDLPDPKKCGSGGSGWIKQEMDIKRNAYIMEKV